jgi:hypothetical protein
MIVPPMHAFRLRNGEIWPDVTDRLPVPRSEDSCMPLQIEQPDTPVRHHADPTQARASRT